MTVTTEKERQEFQQEVAAWFLENNPGDPGFLLPETFMEVGTDAQFEYLRDWQRKVYEAGLSGYRVAGRIWGQGDAPSVSGHCNTGNGKPTSALYA